MIISQLFGGLGNQMFQYALGRRLAIERDVPLKLDLSWFAQQTKRRYCLNQFQISAEIATPVEIHFFTKSHWPSVLRKIFKRLQTKYPEWLGQIVTYQSLGYCSQVLDVPKRAYLKGYWQSEKYFLNIRSILLNELRIKEPLDYENQRILDEIRGTNSIGVHIRHGDYINDSRTNQIHGVLPIDYYVRGMQILEDNVDFPHYYVFSDDIHWARQNLGTLKKITIVDHNDTGHEHFDFSLMSACKHHIIANSSFSWWAAWLNDYSHKIVIAPKRWFMETSMDTRDLIPPAWMII